MGTWEDMVDMAPGVQEGMEVRCYDLHISF